MSLDATMTQISAQFVEVQGRRVFVRYAGEGPAVLLLHQSPQNSRAMIPWIERLSVRYAVFAPDTPGFGCSDSLPLAQPTIPDYAAALARLLDVLKIDRVLVYGVHTGAVTALRLSLDFPSRVAALVCDGYARFTTPERQKLLDGYLPPFEPSWEGAHLLWLWARFREQNLFFPWNVNTKEARLAYPAPSTEKLHADVMDLLDAGDGYRIGYRAPFLYDDATAASRLTVPTKIFYRAEDVLAPHMTRLGALPANVEVSNVEGGAAKLAELNDAMFSMHAHEATTLASQAAIVSSMARTNVLTPSSRRLFATSAGPLVCRIHEGETNRALVVLHDIGTPPKSPIDADFGAIVVTVELPGHGASRPWGADANAGAFSVDRIAQAINEVLVALNVSGFSIRAEGGACAIAVLLAAGLSATSTCMGLTLHNPMPLDETERAQFLSLLPDATPQSTGAHLIAAWNWARMKHLFWPWLPQNAAAARKTDAPAPLRVHGEALEIIRCGEGFCAMWQSALALSLTASLASLRCPVIVSVDDEPERQRLAARLTAGLRLGAPTTHAGVITWRS
jgi:pimeloyl-ACP methyl ester carboxylesterase